MTVLTVTEGLLVELEKSDTPLGQLALRLAAALDVAEPAALANLSREFRLTVVELVRDVDKPLEDGLSRLLESLSSPVAGEPVKPKRARVKRG